MATKVGEFFINLAVDAASGNLSVNELVQSLGRLDVVSVGTVGVLSKITSTLWSLGKAAGATAVEMSVLRDISGVDPKMVQQWERAAQRISVQAGTITGAVKGVNDMMGAIAARKASPPAELTGWLGITPHTGKTDARGFPVMKTFFDLMTEIANPKNRYWTMPPQVQQNLLGGIFQGADPKDLFRILNEMRAGRFKPETIAALEDKQVKELTEVNRKNTEMGQRMSGIFEKLILGGGAFASILDTINQKLDVFDKWLASKQGNQALGALGESFNLVLRNNGNPYKVGTDWGDRLGRFLFPMPAGATGQRVKFEDLKGRVDITVRDPRGEQVGMGSAFLGSKVSNADVERTTVNTGNGGLGQ